MLPTAVPTVPPTTEDTVTVAVSLILVSPLEPRAAERGGLKGVVAAACNVALHRIHRFTVVATATTHRLAVDLRNTAAAIDRTEAKQQWQRRRRLSGFTCEVSFEVVVPLAGRCCRRERPGGVDRGFRARKIKTTSRAAAEGGKKAQRPARRQRRSTFHGEEEVLVAP